MQRLSGKSAMAITAFAFAITSWSGTANAQDQQVEAQKVTLHVPVELKDMLATSARVNCHVVTKDGTDVGGYAVEHNISGGELTRSFDMVIGPRPGRSFVDATGYKCWLWLSDPSTPHYSKPTTINPKDFLRPKPRTLFVPVVEGDFPPSLTNVLKVPGGLKPKQ